MRMQTPEQILLLSQGYRLENKEESNQQQCYICVYFQFKRLVLKGIWFPASFKYIDLTFELVGFKADPANLCAIYMKRAISELHLPRKSIG